MSDAITPPKIFNVQDVFSVYSKIVLATSAALRRALTSSLPSLKSESNAPPVDTNVVKLEECEEEFDMTKREAKFAFRSTDLGSWDSTGTPHDGSNNSSSDPMTIQHWAVVIHFPRGKKTYVFQAWGDNGLLQAGRAENVNREVFEKATYFGTTETDPCELMAKAKQVSTGEYRILGNNCQTWVKDFVRLVSPELLTSLYVKIPATRLK
ncbi:hypothetical protein DAPPUDRAFT_243745 [Daphnia pulex]|uniref:Uncharacterized protein n=1 Tax=Daphnia pulex TaxID=6669 RepID=E9GJJ9_DAPPU|nr:hypothetical protein DAPPUDRAFT_243745 [Daphnia pulex]|eukprot:EFX80488.1 hypothetical protein DAPPUDRAFT_243745 [Daphnia pulex]